MDIRNAFIQGAYFRDGERGAYLRVPKQLIGREFVDARSGRRIIFSSSDILKLKKPIYGLND